MLQYILECIAFQLAFLIIYDFFLKRETFFQWNRAYLIGTYILSLVLPWIKIEALKNAVPQQYVAYSEYLWNTNDAAVLLRGTDTSTVSWEPMLLFGGMFIATLLLVYKIMQLYRLRKNGEVHFFRDFTKIIISNSSAAFSFFKSIFIGDKILKDEQEHIIRHELVHIRQGHSFDLFFFELMRIIGWFDPLVYIYQGRVSELHEFIADAHVAKGNRREQYQQMLSRAFQTENISFINQFFKSSLIKKRIVMLQKTKSKRIFQLKYLLLVPVVTAMLFYSSCQDEIGSDNIETITVADIENLSQEEETNIYTKIIDHSVSGENWILKVRDKNSTLTFSKAPEGSSISGPDGIPINAKMHVESKVLDGNFNFFDNSSKGIKISKDDGGSGLETKYQWLYMERNRLLEKMDEDSPVIKNLDGQMEKVKQEILANHNGTLPFAWVDQAPIFPGCEDSDDSRACFQEKIQRHISKNFRYPEEAQEQGIQGRVNTMFTITKDGTIIDIRKRGPHRLLEEEVVRIISRLPRMLPGKQGDKAVNVPFSIPITFRLDNLVQKEKAKSDEIRRANTNTISVSAFSQSNREMKSIIGKVSDGIMPLPGATISVEGSERGVISDFDGNFSISAETGDIIIVQYIGLPVIRFTITDESDYRITRNK